MKILLITPLYSYTKTRWTPLGISYIASLLKTNGHQVRLFDRMLKSYQLGNKKLVDQEMKKEILSYQPDIIGFSTISEVIYDTAECVSFIRGFFEGTIVAGGHHCTALPQISLNKMPGLDYVVVGEAEYSILSLAKGDSPHHTEGLVTRKSEKPNWTHPRIENLDDLPLPDYSIFDMDYYTEANKDTVRGIYLRTACILTSRGCPFNCRFCSESLNFGKGVRFHSADYVVENIERLVMDYKVEGLYFHDNNFLYSKNHVENICRKLIQKNLHRQIKWAIQGSSVFINEDILKTLSEAGCIKIELGIESINESSLVSMNKNSTISLNEKALSLCKKYDISTHAYFMTGFEDETITDLENTLTWIKKYRPDTFSLHPLKIYPGTALYADEGGGFFENNDWTEENIKSYFRQDKLSSISPEERHKWYYKKYKNFSTRYQRINLIKSNPLKSILRMAYKKLFPRAKN